MSEYPIIPVSDRARRYAARFVAEGIQGYTQRQLMEAQVTAGREDHRPLVQAFARFEEEVSLPPCSRCGLSNAQMISGAPGCHFVQCRSCKAETNDMSRERARRDWALGRVKFPADQPHCGHCDGTGTQTSFRDECCGGSHWECGASGCVGPRQIECRDACEACRGTGVELADG